MLIAAGWVCGAPADAGPTTCPDVRPVLVNGSFEEPVVRPGFPRTTPADTVPGWDTNQPAMEIWPPGVTEGPPSGGGPYTAAQGDQFIEINAQQPETIHQDINTSTAAPLVLLVEAYHRGRTNPNTALVAVGAPNGLIDFHTEMTDPPQAWGRYDWALNIPAGQPVTRVGFAPLTGTGPGNSIGNLLDAVRVQAAGCLVATKTATTIGSHRVPHVGDVIEYRVRTRNTGPTAVALPVLRDQAPNGTTYVTGSLHLLDGPYRGPLSDAADADQGSVRAGRVRVDLGTSAGDQLAPGASVGMSFRVRVAAAAAGTRIENEATVGYRLLDLAHTVVHDPQLARTNTTTSARVPPPAPPPPPGPPTPTTSPTTSTTTSPIPSPSPAPGEPPSPGATAGTGTGGSPPGAGGTGPGTGSGLLPNTGSPLGGRSLVALLATGVAATAGGIALVTTGLRVRSRRRAAPRGRSAQKRTGVPWSN